MSGIILSGPRIMRLRELLVAIAQQQVRIPRFQRPFVWEDTQRLELLESIYRGMPIGSVLVWSTDQELECYPRLGRYVFGRAPAGRVVEYVLDGHQRLTTLFGALVPGALVGYVDEPQEGYAEYTGEDGASWPLYFNLATERFTLGLTRTEDQPLIKLDAALDSFALIDFQRELLMSERAKAAPEEYKKMANRAQHLNRVFSDYMIPIVPLLTNDLDAAAEAFRRVNETGTKMSEAHMLHALTFKQELRLVERLDAMRQELAPLGWYETPDELLLKVIKLRLNLDPGRAHPAELVKRLSDKDGGVLDEVLGGVKRAVEFLGRHCDIYGPRLLPYELQLVFLADVLCKEPTPGDRGCEALKRWVWRTTAQGGELLPYRAQRDELRSLARSAGEIVAGGGGRRLSLSDRFNAPHVSSKVWMMLLAKEAAKYERDGDESALRIAGREGVEAFWRMPGVDAMEVAGRFYVPMSERADFAARLASSRQDKEFLARHLLPSVPYKGPRYDQPRDVKTRSGRLHRLWREFWEEQGFKLE